MTSKPIWESKNPNINVLGIDFAGICALRNKQQRPMILSGGALLICREKREVILHRRGSQVATYPNCLHIFGGNYIHPEFGGMNADRRGIISTVRREILEETQVETSIHTTDNLIASQEIKTGFVQFVFLGTNVSRREVDNASGNWEGSIERIPFKSLCDVLSNNNWVPSGKALVFAWLALGAPNAGYRPRFNGLSAHQLFKKFIS